MSVRTTRATGAGAVATTIAPGYAWQLKEIRIHLSAGGAATAFTATLDSGTNAAYDLLLYTKDMDGILDVLRTFDPPLEFDAGDEVDIAYTNGGAATFGLEVKYRSSH